jgi:hypothetical protein
VLGEGVRVLQTARQQVCLSQGEQTERLEVDACPGEFAEKADKAPQPAIGRECADVDARHDDGAIRRDQLPAEAARVVRAVDAASPAAAVGGEAGLHGGHHGTEDLVP